MDELGRPSAEEQRAAPKHPLIVILDDVRSMQNVGSVFRTCDAFAVEELYLCGYTPQPPHRDIHKTALGATDTVAWRHFATVNEAIAAARAKGYTIAAVEQAHNSISLTGAGGRYERTALVFGNEVTGVSDAALSLADACIEIPQWGSKHSLNVSVTVGVVLWEMVRK
ncbi:RNA methyltransferase [Nemorincola caseinilytica]|uniref:RNA methyltransferase n=2 Tax=Nemorincola caseinilytica TaxID=2054315 RepID=A0ABP8NB51_9BACT